MEHTGYKTLEMQVEDRIISQCNKLLIDFKKPPANQLPQADERYDESQFARLYPDAYSPDKYPLTDEEIDDLADYRLLEAVRYEQIPIINLLDHAEAVNTYDYPTPLLYVVPSLGMQPVTLDATPQNARNYIYPVNLRLILNREQQSFDLTNLQAESLIREGLKYVLDESIFTTMTSRRPGFNEHESNIPFNERGHSGFTRQTLEGFMAPIEAFDYQMNLIIQEQRIRRF